MDRINPRNGHGTPKGEAGNTPAAPAASAAPPLAALEADQADIADVRTVLIVIGVSGSGKTTIHIRSAMAALSTAQAVKTHTDIAKIAFAGELQPDRMIGW
jgi:hypothetical protein